MSTTVCSIDYIGKNYSEKDAPYVASLHLQVEDTLTKLGKGVIQKGFNKSPNFRPKNYSTETYNKMNNIVNRVNAIYDGKVVQIKKDVRSRNYLVVNVNPITGKNLFFTKDAIQKQENDTYGERDGDILNTSDLEYERRVTGLEEYDQVTLDELIDQAQIMETKFKKAGVSVHVILDGDLKGSGALLGKNDPKRISMVSDGIISEDGFVISINPKQLASDTLLHEFGHIFIDLIGGASNARVQAAYQKLKGSPTYARILELYPELKEDSDTFVKEVVNTALGMEATTLFAQKDTQNWWNRFTDWLNETVGRLFNLEKNHIKDLTKDFLSVETKTFGSPEVNTDTYLHKRDPKVKANLKRISNSIDSINDANKVIKADIDKLIQDYERNTAQRLTAGLAAEKGDTSQEAKLFKLKQISEKFHKIKKGEEQKFLLEFTKEITSTVENFKNALDGYVQGMQAGKSYNVDSRINTLSLIKHYSNLFSIAESIISDVNYMGLNAENKVIVENALTEVIAKKDGLLRNYKDLAINVIIQTQAGNFDKIRVEYRDRFRQQYDSTKDDAITDVNVGETRDAFVGRMLAEMHDEILEETKDYLRDQFRESLDIGSIEMLLRDEKSINSTSITLMSRLLDEADLKRNREFMKFRNRAEQIHKEFRDQFGSMDQRKMYDSLIEDTEDSSYLIGEYKPEFYETILKFSKQVTELEQKVEDETDPVKQKLLKVQLRKLKAEKTKWFKDNTKKVEVSPTEISNLPSDKWLNTKYKAIKANPDSPQAKMLAFLEELNDIAEKNTKGLKTLNRNVDGIETVFRRLPAVERDSLEKLSGGDYAANAKDTFERLFKRKEDDEEFGATDSDEDTEIANARNAFKNLSIVKGNFAGDERHLIPIFFRHKFNKKANSYDLMSSYMMNLYMSQNFKEKSAMQPIAQLLVDVNEMKRTMASKGVAQLAKAQFITQKEQKAIEQRDTSNEQKKLESMLENRLYGIKTIEQEYSKIIETVMGWSGTTMLALNFYSGMANIVQGKVMNFIEGVGGEFFNNAELVKGEAKFFKDMDQWVKDIGAVNNRSRTRLLMDLIDPAGDFKGVAQRYVRSNKMAGLATRGTLSFPNTMGEMYVQGTLMYTVLSKIKPMDKDGNYFDKNKRPTKDQSKAIGLDEIILFNEDGSFSLPEGVANTSFSDTANGDHDKIFLETRNLIKKITADLHGQYDSEIQSHAQRTMIGKALFMLRKWVIPGVDRRFRGAVHTMGKDWMDFDQIENEDFRAKRFYSQDTKSFREGTYTTMIRFTRQLIKEGELLNGFIGSKTNTWSKMTDHERANIKKWAVEFATIILSIISAWVLKGLADDLPEDEAQAVFLAAYGFRRLHQELVAYINPIEALQLMRSPAASISLVENSFKLLGQTMYDGTNILMGNDAEVYQTGKRKGTLKWAKDFKSVFPVLSQTNRNLEDVMEYTFAAY